MLWVGHTYMSMKTCSWTSVTPSSAGATGPVTVWTARASVDGTMDPSMAWLSQAPPSAAVADEQMTAVLQLVILKNLAVRIAE